MDYGGDEWARDVFVNQGEVIDTHKYNKALDFHKGAVKIKRFIVFVDRSSGERRQAHYY